MNKLVILSYVLLNLIGIVYGVCDVWSEWAGDCRLQFCGECNQLKRTRDCTEENEVKEELRNCYNIPCLFPCPSCHSHCRQTYNDNQFGCISRNAVRYPTDFAPTIPRGANSHSATCSSTRITIPPPLTNRRFRL